VEDRLPMGGYWVQLGVGAVLAFGGVFGSVFAWVLFIVISRANGSALLGVISTIVVAFVPLIVLLGPVVKSPRRSQWHGWIQGVLLGWCLAALIDGVCFIRMN
jgi:hypothetical protein